MQLYRILRDGQIRLAVSIEIAGGEVQWNSGNRRAGRLYCESPIPIAEENVDDRIVTIDNGQSGIPFSLKSASTICVISVGKTWYRSQKWRGKRAHLLFPAGSLWGFEPYRGTPNPEFHPH